MEAKEAALVDRDGAIKKLQDCQALMKKMAIDRQEEKKIWEEEKAKLEKEKAEWERLGQVSVGSLFVEHEYSVTEQRDRKTG